MKGEIVSPRSIVATSLSFICASTVPGYALDSKIVCVGDAHRRLSLVSEVR
jgi:hypothetical protein